MPLGIWNTSCVWNGDGILEDAWIGLQAAQPYGQIQSNRKFWGFGKSFKHLKMEIRGKLVLPAANPPGRLGTDSRASTEWGILEQDFGQKSFQGWRCEDLGIREVSRGWSMSREGAGEGLEHRERLRELEQRRLRRDLLPLCNSWKGGRSQSGFSPREGGTGQQEMASSGVRAGLGWISGKISSWKALPSLGTAAQGSGVTIPGGI